jgi:hypothetical protein
MSLDKAFGRILRAYCSSFFMRNEAAEPMFYDVHESFGLGNQALVGDLYDARSKPDPKTGTADIVLSGAGGHLGERSRRTDIPGLQDCRNRILYRRYGIQSGPAATGNAAPIRI